MKIIHFRDMEKFRGGTVTGIGKFDGIHLGHRVILETIAREATRTNSVPAVFTFRRFPADFLLCGWDEKLSLLKNSGVKICFWCDLSEVVHLSPSEFLDILLASGVRTLVLGYDFHFGAGRKGNIEFLRSVKKERGFNLVVVPPQKVNGEVVNASEIRSFIRKGDVAKANSFLGRYFSVSGKVTKGSNIGSTMGFPTANLALDNDIRIGEGIYAGWAEHKREVYKAAIVTGVSPTFKDKASKFEVYMIGFSPRDIYGEKIKVFLFKKLRNQLRFPDKESLKVRIAADVKEITALIASKPAPESLFVSPRGRKVPLILK